MRKGFKSMLHELDSYRKTYEFFFQFNFSQCGVCIMKDGIVLIDSLGHESPEDAINEALEYLNQVNNNQIK